ncbi:MAG: carboxypeptidase regulatory-like domain-containing protein [Candidatus Caldarchaeum sp.]
MLLKGFVFDDEGNPVASATVTAYRVNENAPAASTTTATNGAWSLVVPDGSQYRVVASWGGAQRILESRLRLQVERIYGPDGVTAPLPPASVTGEMIAPGAISPTHLSETFVLNDQNIPPGSITDAHLSPDIGYLERVVADGRVITFVKGDQLELRSGAGINFSVDTDSKIISIESSLFSPSDLFYWVALFETPE